MKKLSSEQEQELLDALENAVRLREVGEGGGHAVLIQILQRLGYTTMSSREAEKIAEKLLALSQTPNDY